ncbi:MAG: hypothetical protein BWY59_00126 [Verrucomicrobia bacterium ADurb.Bin345]|nr:MAG: hypothetical protein BWY59_00126 [Verrucomicrobia bacterium ADurb.Bin345]
MLAALPPHSVTFVMSVPFPRWKPEMTTVYPPVAEPESGSTPGNSTVYAGSHLATREAEMPSAVVNSPPAYRLVPSCASARTMPLTPLPRLVQVPFAGFHFATRWATTPLALVNSPPAYRYIPS